MEYRIQEVINKLETLQYDILFWEKKEKNKEKVDRLSVYDRNLDEVIDMLYSIGLYD